MNKSSISFLIPCLNESATLPYVLEKVHNLKLNELYDRNVEVILSDNGSSDGSIEIAEKFNVRVIHCTERGYGAALKFGIQSANNDIIIYADADNTYDFLESIKLINEIENGYDLVIGSRLKGHIQKNAMPFIHRFIGTPILTLIINILYNKTSSKISDCNSGFRCFQKRKFNEWEIHGSGMEFASEMLVKALKHNANFSEVPINLYKDMRNRVPHLKTWRDGMRHLLQIFLNSPKFFNISGSVIFLFSWLIIVASLFFGPLLFFKFSILGIHTIMFSMLGTFFGLLIWGIGLNLNARQNDPIKVYNLALNMIEDKLLIFFCILFLISAGLFSLIIYKWSLNHFIFLAIEKETLAITSFAADIIFIFSSVFSANLIKRI